MEQVARRQLRKLLAGFIQSSSFSSWLGASWQGCSAAAGRALGGADGEGAHSCAVRQKLHQQSNGQDANGSVTPAKNVENSSKGLTVAVGMSGGVDSSVAALLLQQQGYKVHGLFMRNWDPMDEAGGGECKGEMDYLDALQVARHLEIELEVVDYVQRYWVEVFETFVDECGKGLTPNPDLDCNRFIKFDALLQHSLRGGAHKLATGHYARTRLDSCTGHVQLLRGRDSSKDQSYFLASVGQRALQQVLFPLGAMSKGEVRQVAASAGLLTAHKRSSAGICFVGRRKFADFIGEYVEARRGPLISVEGGAPMGEHDGIAAYTHGQRARIAGAPVPWFVAGKDLPRGIIFVAPGSDHPALFCTSAVADSLFWVAGEPPEVLKQGGVMQCRYKSRYGQPAEPCTVALAHASSPAALRAGMGLAAQGRAEFLPSTFCRLGAI
eukprot:jgi/Mesen1/1719/ME000138S00578